MQFFLIYLLCSANTTESQKRLSYTQVRVYIYIYNIITLITFVLRILFSWQQIQGACLVYLQTTFK